MIRDRAIKDLNLNSLHYKHNSLADYNRIRDLFKLLKVNEQCPFRSRKACDDNLTKLRIHQQLSQASSDLPSGVQPPTCDKVHFSIRPMANTDFCLGDCSYLESCRHMESCKYVHY